MRVCERVRKKERARAREGYDGAMVHREERDKRTFANLLAYS